MHAKCHQSTIEYIVFQANINTILPQCKYIYRSQWKRWKLGAKQCHHSQFSIDAYIKSKCYCVFIVENVKLSENIMQWYILNEESGKKNSQQTFMTL